MAKTRGATRKRRKIDPDFEYEYDDKVERLLEEEQLQEEEVDDEEKMSQMTNENKDRPVGRLFDEVPPEILTHILSFVGNARDVFNLARSRKSFRDAITSEIVIKAAVFGEKQTRQVLENVMKKIKSRSILAPSTFRLLRLVNATKCERLEDCFAYNLQKKQSNDISNHKERPYGLCICYSCSAGLSFCPYHSVDHERVARENCRLLTTPHVEHATGEPIGPVILGHKIKQVYLSYKDHEEMKKAIDDLFHQADDELAESEAARHETLVGIYETALDNYIRREETKRHMKVEQWKAKRDKRAAKKRERVEQVYAEIESLLADYEHKEIALEGEWGEYTGVFVCRLAPSDAIIGPLFRAPSYANQKAIVSKVESVKEAYNLIYSNGFCTGTVSSFLSFLENSEEQHEKAIYNYRGNFDVNFFVSEAFLEHIGMNFIAKLREGEAFEAFFPHLAEDNRKEAFVQSMVKDETDEQTMEYFKLLARTIWRLRFGVSGPHYNGEVFRTFYLECSAEYACLAGNLKIYMELRNVRTFLTLRGPPVNRPNQTFSRHNALKLFFALRHGSRTLLRERRFKELYTLHKRIFGNPMRYII